MLLWRHSPEWRDNVNRTAWIVFGGLAVLGLVVGVLLLRPSTPLGNVVRVEVTSAYPPFAAAKPGERLWIVHFDRGVEARDGDSGKFVEMLLTVGKIRGVDDQEKEHVSVANPAERESDRTRVRTMVFSLPEARTLKSLQVEGGRRAELPAP